MESQFIALGQEVSMTLIAILCALYNEVRLITRVYGMIATTGNSYTVAMVITG